MFGECSTVERGHRNYIDCICTFDIETTTILKDEKINPIKEDFGFMYVWQFCVDGTVVMGRTWKEYKIFLERLERNMKLGTRKCVIYVHNLPFEFQFFRNFFTIGKTFSRKKRDLVYCEVGNFEYRCSYALSNMGLAKFLEKTKGVTFNKLDGSKFNYKIKRYPDTELSEMELAYCVCDVLGLYEAIREHLVSDTLCTIPITSTGYVRRDYKEVCLASKGYQHQMKKIALNSKTYTLCREASRGAISGSNHINTNETLEEVDSFDIKSSYPYQMATKLYPQSKFLMYKAEYGTDKFDKLLKDWCCLIVWSCEHIKLKHWTGIPYISKAKCRAIENAKCGNGKVYYADKIGMCCTEIDFRIISELYDFENVKIHEIWCAAKDMLPTPFRKHLLEMFQIKTDLEDGDPFLYNKYKNKINASFGMMLTDILHPEIIYQPNSTDPWKEEELSDIDKALKYYYNNRNSFLSYQHGVWILAHARDSLNEGMQIVKHDLVQVDTDSVKNLGDYRDEFEKINKRIIANAENYDIKPYAIKGNSKVYLGIWEHESKKGRDPKLPTYDKFRTLGAKKYIVEVDGKLETTVAGLSKKAGEWFMKNGGIEKFQNGIEVPAGPSGRTCSIYNDWIDIKHFKIDGHFIEVGSNIAIKDVPYTLGMTSEWSLLVLDGYINKDELIQSNGAYKGW